MASASVVGSRGHWRVAYRFGGRESKQKKKGTFKTREEAQAWADEFKRTHPSDAELNAPALPTDELSGLFVRYAIYRVQTLKRARPHYIKEAPYILGALAKKLEWTTLKDITKASILTVGRRKPLEILRVFLKYCMNVLDIPLDGRLLNFELPAKGKRGRREALTMEQAMTALWTSFKVGGVGVGLLVEHLMLYGCRPVDLCRAKVKDWDSAKGLITYCDTKNKSDITHPVHQQHARKLDQHVAGRDPESPLFVDPWGRPWHLDETTGAATGLCSWYRQNVGEHCLPKGQWGIYRLKGFAMTRLTKAAAGDLKSVATVSGHFDVDSIVAYLGTNQENQRALLGNVPYVEVGNTDGNTDRFSVQTSDPMVRRKRKPVQAIAAL